MRYIYFCQFGNLTLKQFLTAYCIVHMCHSLDIDGYQFPQSQLLIFRGLTIHLQGWDKQNNHILLQNSQYKRRYPHHPHKSFGL
jgi:hypothetical protein